MTERRNYQGQLDQILKEKCKEGRIPTLLLHSCCAPCSSYVLEYLSSYFSITDFFYDPNISPETEYRKREAELARLIQKMPMKHPVTFLPGKYEPSRFFSAVKGLEGEKEGGKRCTVCFSLRLGEAARMAAEGGFDYFTTTLTISPMKDVDRLNRIGEEMGEKYGVAFLPSAFRKRNGYLRSIELSKEYGLYRQDYCGCPFSKAEREEKKLRDLKEGA